MVTLTSVSNFKEFYDNNKSFIEERYDEATEACNSTRPIDIDFNLFQQLIDIETVFLFEIYKEDKFIGYASLTVCPALLHKNKVDATIDHIALDKVSRKQGVAKEVIGYIEEFLTTVGVDEVKLMLPATELHDTFADKLSYNKALTTHIKRLT